MVSTRSVSYIRLGPYIRPQVNLGSIMTPFIARKNVFSYLDLALVETAIFIVYSGVSATNQLTFSKTENKYNLLLQNYKLSLIINHIPCLINSQILEDGYNLQKFTFEILIRKLMFVSLLLSFSTS